MSIPNSEMYLYVNNTTVSKVSRCKYLFSSELIISVPLTGADPGFDQGGGPRS